MLCSDRTIRRRLLERAESPPSCTRYAWLDDQLGVTVSEISADGYITKAPCDGEKAEPSPVDRRKGGLKHSAPTEGSGVPRGVHEEADHVRRYCFSADESSRIPARRAVAAGAALEQVDLRHARRPVVSGTPRRPHGHRCVRASRTATTRTPLAARNDEPAPPGLIPGQAVDVVDMVEQWPMCVFS
jgi:hypothetical protein